jgi:hypothetical protein
VDDTQSHSAREVVRATQDSRHASP